MKKNTLFFSSLVILLAFVVMISFAGCKNSPDSPEDNSSNSSVLQNNDSNSDNLADNDDNNADNTQNTSDNSVVTSGKKPTTSENNSISQDGQDVFIDFGEDEEIDVNTSSTVTNNKTSSTISKDDSSKPQNTTSNDGWTNDYIIKN